MSERVKVEVIHDVVKSLVGEVYPAGESHTDSIRRENLDTYIELFNLIIDDLHFIAGKKGDYRASVRDIGKVAHDEFVDLKEFLIEGF